jgi:hypothetical protein
VLYHQIHPAKLAADITGSIISTYLMWHRRFGPAMLAAWVPAILGSALVLRFADLERLKHSAFGHYIRQFMTRRIEAWRFAGQIVMWVGARGAENTGATAFMILEGILLVLALIMTFKAFSRDDT